jgi:hypothetical protein
METPPSNPDPETAALRWCLAERDVACPGCGYNLRGTSERRCSECGCPLELRVVQAGPVGAWRWFLLLAFGWVAWVGAFAGTGYGRVIYSIVWGPRLQAAQGRTFATSGVNASLSPDGMVTMDFSNATFGTSPPATVPALAWRSVSTLTWLELSIGVCLAVAGGVGLLALFWNWKRPWTRVRLRRLITASTVCIGVHVFWQITMAVRSML